MAMKKSFDLKRILRGDRREFERFYAATYRSLLAYVELKVESRRDAEEVVHDSYLSLLESLPLFRGKSSLETFLSGIAKHEVADYWRKKYAKKALLTVPFMDQLYTEKLYSAAVLNHEIERIYGALAKDYVVILRLKYEKGMTVGQIAKHLSMSVKAVESKLFRARKAFQAVYVETYGK